MIFLSRNTEAMTVILIAVFSADLIRAKPSHGEFHKRMITTSMTFLPASEIVVNNFDRLTNLCTSDVSEGAFTA